MPIGGCCRVCGVKFCTADHPEWPCTFCGKTLPRDDFRPVRRRTTYVPSRNHRCRVCEYNLRFGATKGKWRQ